MAQEINAENFSQAIKSSKVVMVDLWANWCGPCRAIAPMIDELSREFSGKATIFKLNIDQNPSIHHQFNVKNIPTLLFFKNGQLVDKMGGATQKAWIAEKINSLL